MRISPPIFFKFQQRKLFDGSEGFGSEKLLLVMPHDWVKNLESAGMPEAVTASAQS